MANSLTVRYGDVLGIDDHRQHKDRPGVYAAGESVAIRIDAELPGGFTALYVRGSKEVKR